MGFSHEIRSHGSGRRPFANVHPPREECRPGGTAETPRPMAQRTVVNGMNVE